MQKIPDSGGVVVLKRELIHVKPGRILRQSSCRSHNECQSKNSFCEVLKKKCAHEVPRDIRTVIVGRVEDMDHLSRKLVHGQKYLLFYASIPRIHDSRLEVGRKSVLMG